MRHTEVDAPHSRCVNSTETGHLKWPQADGLDNGLAGAFRPPTAGPQVAVHGALV
jgi:hypothetical protein